MGGLLSGAQPKLSGLSAWRRTPRISRRMPSPAAEAAPSPYIRVDDWSDISTSLLVSVAPAQPPKGAEISVCELVDKFDVIDYRVEVAFPILPHIIQSALNTVQQVSDGESWNQILLKIVNEAVKTWPSTDWKQAKKNVLKSQPPRPQDVGEHGPSDGCAGVWWRAGEYPAL